jgi:hypothetical protein
MQVTIVPEKIERGSSAAASPRRCKFAGRISEDQPRLAGSAPSCSFASSTPTGRYYDRPGKGSHEIWYSPITKLGSRFPIEPMSRTETCERDFKSRPDCRITSSGGRHGRIGLLAVFCCFPGNYQRTASHSRRESWTSARSRAEITAKQPLFFRCSLKNARAARPLPPELFRLVARWNQHSSANIINFLFCQLTEFDLPGDDATRQKPGDGAAHAGGDRAGQDRTQAQCRDLAAPFGHHRPKPANQNTE